MATALPPSSDFTGSALTEGGFKSAVTDMRAFLAGLLGTSGEQSAALAAMGALLNGSVAKSGAYTVVAADRGKVISCTGTFTLSVTAAATLGAGFTFAVHNASTGTITIDPNLSEQINGATTLTVAASQLAIVYCTGTSFAAVAGSNGLLAVTTHTTNGTHTTHTLCKKLVAMAVAGGGAGAGCPSYSISAPLLEGGKAGAVKWASTTSPASTYAITIGSGGTGTSSTGNPGGNTSVGSLLTAEGGHGGNVLLGDGAGATCGPAGDSSYGIGGAKRTTFGTGNAASANTGGGGGAGFSTGTGQAAQTGGAGGSGLVIIWEFA